jgi:hypothetical protein
MIEETLHLFVNGRVLLVGADEVLALTPQGVHRVEFGAPVRQPQQVDVEALSQPRRSLGRVAGVFVQEQRHVPATVTAMDLAQERLEVSGPLMLARQEQSPARTQVQGPEYSPPRVTPTQENAFGLAFVRPARP